MSTTIEQAIASLLETHQPITVANVLAAYLQLAGFVQTSPSSALSESPDTTDPDAEAAIIAFEHAMDKHPVPPQPPLRRGKKSVKSIAPAMTTTVYSYKRMYTAEVAELREQYWRERLGCGNVLRCTCSGCGKTVHYVAEDDAGGQLQIDDANMAARRKKRVAGNRKTKQRAIQTLSSESESSQDPYRASTSAFVL